ncbi:hypothetical protein MKW92_006741 [Papaver armeniacum]|nr:hypothetical protein MKW92_006741 [Papaver armeniacum]
MDMSQNDLDRLMFFDHARKTSEVAYEANPLDADNLTRWAGALLELSQFQSISESKMMIKARCPMVFGKRLYFSRISDSELDVAKGYFDKAAVYFQEAVEEDPANELYQKSLEMNSKYAPELHMEIHKQGFGQTLTGGGGSSTSSNMKGAKKKKNTDLYYDIGGWFVLVLGIAVWIGFAKSQAPPSPPR